MSYLTKEIQAALEAEGKAFCTKHSLVQGTHDSETIVKINDIRAALQEPEGDPTQYCKLHEVPHVVWIIAGSTFGI